MDSTYNRFKKFCIEYSKGFSSLQEAELTTVLELIQKLTELRNHPNERYGKEKAEFISNWLNSNSVKASIIPVDNLDETKTANKDNKWYNVLAILGDEHSSDAAPKGLFSVHHDQVAKLNPSFNLTDEMHLEHPWLEDDIIQLATSMMEAVSFQKWWNIQSQKHNLIGSIHYIISDGEEVNTLGMRGLLEKFYAEKNILQW